MQPFRRHLSVSAVGVLLGFTELLHAQVSAPAPRVIPTDTGVMQQLRGGETHRYLLRLGSDRFVRILVQQRGIDVVVTLRNAAGDSLAAIDSPNGTDGPEPLAFRFRREGDYLIEVTALEAKASPGHYSIVIPENRTAVSADDDLLQAELAMAAGKTAIVQETRASFAEATRQYRIALTSFEAAGDSAQVANAILHLGDAQIRVGNARAALPLLERGVGLAERHGTVDLQLNLLNQVGQAYSQVQGLQKAVEYFRRMRRLAESSGDTRMEASALSNMSGDFQQLGMLDSAVFALERALTISQRVGDKTREAPALNSLGLLYYRAGEIDKALDAYNRALRLVRELGNKSGEMSILGNLAGAYAYLSNVDQALVHRRRALQIARERGDVNAEATYLNNMAMSLEDIGDTTSAISYLNQAFDLAKKSDNRGIQAQASENLGRLLSERRDQREVALAHFQRALELWRASGDLHGEATTLTEMAELQSLLGRTTEAWNSFERGLALLRQTQQRTHEVRTLDQMARLAESEGTFVRADSLSSDAIELAEKIRRQISDRRLRISFQAMAQGAYQTRISILMSMHRGAPRAGHDVAAAEIVERARARGLLDALADGHLDVSRGIDPTVVAKERELSIRVDSIARVLRAHAMASDTAPQRRIASEALDRANAEHQLLRENMRAQNSGYLALSGAPLRMTQVQALLDSNSVLLSYSGGRDAIYLWVITSEAARGVSLDNPSALAGLVRRYVTLVTERNRRVSSETANLRQARLRHANLQMPALGDSISRILLEPAADAFIHKRVLVMASGVLSYLPFGALPIPRGAAGAGRSLVARHEIVFLSSASTVGVLRELRKARPTPSRTIAMLADPVFSQADPRVVIRSTAAAPSPTADAKVQWSAAVRGIEGDGPLPRVRFSRVEADAIARLTRPNERLIAADFDANRAMAMSSQLRDFRIVHFATHGFVNSDYPELSGLAFSMVDRSGAALDGYLRLDQIYGLSLPVDLVVLSACQTALGQDVKGEGIVGLARGFLFAGAASVVATLWKVDDEASAELMRRFYRGMLGPARLTPAEALRAAQDALSRDPRWRDPYYWAGYTLQGDWR